MKNTIQYFAIYPLLFFVSSTSAQITFQKTYGGVQEDYFNSVQQTADGGYIMVGATNSFGAGGYDVYLVKTDLNGDTLWTKTYGGAGNDKGNCVQQTTDSGYIITGSTAGTGPGTQGIYLIKTDVNGDILWTKTYGWAIGLSVKQTLDGGYILDCASDFTFAEVLLIKTNALGDTLWTKTYGIHVLDFGGSIQQTADSGYIITGTRVGYFDVLLIKTDVNGNLIWKRIYGGNSYGENGYSARQTPDGGYIVAGYINSSESDAYLIKTNSVGDTLWTKAYGGDSSEIGFDIYLTSDSGYIISGVTQSFGAGGWDVYLVKSDLIGNILWTKTFGGSMYDEGRSVMKTSDGGYIIAGNTNSFGAGNTDAYLIKTDSIGNSGCYENVATSIVRAPPTIVTIPIDSVVTNFNVVVNFFFPSVGNGGTINTLCTNVGMDEISEENEVNIYPNPTNGVFTVITKTNTAEEISVFNSIGEERLTLTLSKGEGTATIDLSAEARGIYFVKVVQDGKMAVKKIVLM